MKKQVFENGSIKTKKVLPVKTSKEKLIERLENTKSVIDFYNHKQKILEFLRETRK